MAKFLGGNDVSDAVRKILGGNDLRCAVAFWGDGARAFLEGAGARIDEMRIVCDARSGSCNPEELEELGAPDNDRLRHEPGLHAKVYISDRGAFIGSANFSDNGLGFRSDRPGLTEAGTFHKAGSAVWTAAGVWFDALYDGTDVVDDETLVIARDRFRPSPVEQPPEPVRLGSLLDLVVSDPDRFDGLGFVIASRKATKREVKKARVDAVKNGIAQQDEIDEVPDGGVFPGWDSDDVLRWRTTFLEFWIPNDKLRIYPRVVRAVDTKQGNVFSIAGGRAVRQLLPKGCPALSTAQRIDNQIVCQLRDAGEVFFPTAKGLAAAIRKL